MIYRLSPLVSRNQLGELAEQHQLTGHAAEVGVHRGDFAHTFLKDWTGTLACIDPWENLPDYQDQAHTLWGDAKTRQEDYNHCKKRLSEFKNRVVLMRTTSKEACRQFDDETLDFIHLDGNHKKIEEDLSLWYPKVRPGGILAGHDWLCYGEDEEENWGRWVQPAVHALAEREGLDVYLIVEPDHLPWSFYLTRPEC